MGSPVKETGMDYFFPCLKAFLLFTLTGLSMFRMAPRAIKEIHSWSDRIILSLLTGIAFYTIFFLVAQGLLGIPLNGITVWGTFLGIILIGVGLEIYRRWKHLATAFEQGKPQENLSEEATQIPEKKTSREIGMLLVLALIFFFSLNIRIQNQLKYPDKLLDADPYRHHIRTEALIETGYLSKFDPYIIGEVPIFELQGCYILAGVLGVSGPFSAWNLWAWGSQVFGALSILSIYLFTKLAFRDLIAEDLGPPPQRRKKKGPLPKSLTPETVATFLGLMAAALLAASPVHILRTNAGFSEAYAIPLLAPTLLFYLWAARSRVWGDFVWFGVFFTALAFINPVPAVFIVPFFMVHAVYVLVKTRELRWLWGNMLAGGIFLAVLLVWNWKFLATPLFTGAQATSHAGTAGILKAMGKNVSFLDKIAAGFNTFGKEIFRNLGYINLSGRISQNIFGLFGMIPAKSKQFFDGIIIAAASVGSAWVLWDRRNKTWRINEVTTFFFLSFAVFILILFLIPFGFISFTSKYYRYILPISLSLSFLTPYFLWRIILNLFRKDSVRVFSLSVVTLLTLIIAAEGRTWGGWVLNCTPEEYAAADWIKQNTQPSDIVIANWYTGDYLRSLTKRRIVISDYPRVEVEVARKKFNLDIPILPRNPEEVVKYVQENPGTYYLVVSKWGPWGKYEKDPHFKLLKTFGKNSKTLGKVFKVFAEVPQSEGEI